MAGRRLLRFTGTCSQEEFRQRCSEHSFWYHSYYFDNGFVQRGDYDIGRDIASYGFPADMTGMSVLDVGTGSGWFATYFEQLGADVTTVDVRGFCDMDVFKRPGYPDVNTEKASPDRVLPDGRAIYYSPVSKGFWIMKEILGLKAEYVNARIYDLNPDVFGGKKFDLVFLGSLLMHLRDPMGGLMAARSVCRHRLLANSLKPYEDVDETRAMMELMAEPDPIAWWQPNKTCLTKWFRGAGFAEVNVLGTVNLTIDKPYIAEEGYISAGNQTLWLAEAYV
jgi:SAM-dependent methyltransferase